MYDHHIHNLYIKERAKHLNSNYTTRMRVDINSKLHSTSCLGIMQFVSNVQNILHSKHASIVHCMCLSVASSVCQCLCVVSVHC